MGKDCVAKDILGRLSEKRIAEELNISRSTLNYRKGKIYKKIREEVEKGKY